MGAVFFSFGPPRHCSTLARGLAEKNDPRLLAHKEQKEKEKEVRIDLAGIVVFSVTALRRLSQLRKQAAARLGAGTAEPDQER